MRILYMDNYRGFSNKFLNLKDVNFLVGENSTGKTSVLCLIGLLSNVNFWFNQDFNADEFKLGYFDDIVSKFSSDKTYFIVGYFYIDESERKSLAERVNALLIKYIKKASIPHMSEIRYLEKGYDIHAIVKPKKLLVKAREVNIKKYIASIDEYFKVWVDKFHNDIISQSHSNDLLVIKKAPFENNLFYIKNLIMQKIFSIDDKPEAFTSHIPLLLNRVISFAPIRTKPKTVYEGFQKHFSTEGEHVPFVLRNIFDVRSRSKKKKEVKGFIEDFGKESKLFQSIKIKRFGREKTSPFEINVILNGKSFKIANVGYGVSQVLPILTDAIAISKGYWLLIQQPEIHLHPKAQASIGELIYNLYQLDKKKFIIETHSDYIIDRYRFCQSEEKKYSNAQVLFFTRTKTGNDTYEISIEKDGKYSEKQPTDFKEFFIREQLKMLEI